MESDTSNINERIHSTGPDVKSERFNYIVTLSVSCNELTDLRKAVELACDRMTEYSSDINVTDSDIDIE